jgi:hypothetical protein
MFSSRIFSLTVVVLIAIVLQQQSIFGVYATLSRINNVAGLSYDEKYFAANPILDIANDRIYVASSPSSSIPAKVCTFDRTTFTQITTSGCASANTGSVIFYASAADLARNQIFFTTYTTIGRLCKFSTTSGVVSFVSCAVAVSGESNFYSLVIYGDYAYAGDTTFGWSKIVKFDINPSNTFQRISSITLDQLSSGTAYYIKSSQVLNGYGYFLTDVANGYIFVVNLDPANFTFHAVVQSVTSSGYFECSRHHQQFSLRWSLRLNSIRHKVGSLRWPICLGPRHEDHHE